MKEISKGFTLAEVLITLAIIGVIGAMTIPGLVHQQEKSSWVTGLKKVYTVGNQVLQRAGLEVCGTTDIKCIFDGKSSLQAGEALAPYFNIATNCKTTNTGESSDNGCWAEFNVYIDGTSSNNYDWDNDGRYKFITADGMSYAVFSYGACSNKGVSSSSPTYKRCGVFYVDVNGKKGPNKMGRDVFAFWITSNKIPLLYPWGGKEDNYNGTASVNDSTGGDYWWNYNNGNKCRLSGNRSGHYCTGRIMEKNWVMDY